MRVSRKNVLGPGHNQGGRLLVGSSVMSECQGDSHDYLDMACSYTHTKSRDLKSNWLSVD